MTKKPSLAEKLTELDQFEVTDLQKIKLDAEIREIEQNIGSTPTRFYQKEATHWIGLIMAFVTLLGAGFTGYTTWSTFVAQKRSERQIKYSAEILKLVNQANSTDETEREDALLLLGYFRMDAVPILLNYLARTSKPEMTINSLILIKRNVDEPAEVTDQLVISAKKIFQMTNLTDDKTFSAYQNYVQALGRLGKDRRVHVLRLLDELEKDINKENNSVRRYPEFKKGFLRDDIKAAKKELI